MVAPYKRMPVFDEATLPGTLRREHRTKQGVWVVMRVLEGELRLVLTGDAAEMVLTPGCPGLVLPDQPHRVEPLGPLRMQVEFFDRPPEELSPARWP